MFRWEYSTDGGKTWSVDCTARFDSVEEALAHIRDHAVVLYLQRIVLYFKYIPPDEPGHWEVA